MDRTEGINEHILIYNRSGTGRAFIRNRSWVIPPQHILIIPAGIPHSYGADESAPWSIYWMHFSGKSALQIIEILQISKESPLLSVQGIEGLFSLFESTLELAAQSNDPSDAAILSEYLLHIVNRLRHMLHKRARPEPRIDPRIQAAMDYMRNNLTRSCSLNEFASTVSLSVPQFSALFRSHSGTSPLRFFARLRVQRAAQWLIESELPVSAVAEKIGYQDSFYFCRVFRKYIGLSPRQYRRHFKERQIH